MRMEQTGGMMTDRPITWGDAKYELYDRVQAFKAEMQAVENGLPKCERWVFRFLRWICRVRYD